MDFVWYMKVKQDINTRKIYKSKEILNVQRIQKEYGVK